MQGVVLASTSAYRASQLARLGLDFTCAAPEYEEVSAIKLTPYDMALKFAKEKAKSLRSRYPDHLIIGSDQVAAFENTILGKPLSSARAIEQLLQCSGKAVDFYTAVTLINTKTQKLQRGCNKTTVTFRTLSKLEIERYIDAEKPLDCCGSFKIEGLGITLMSAVKSDDPTALIGLPLIILANMLRSENVKMP